MIFYKSNINHCSETAQKIAENPKVAIIEDKVIAIINNKLDGYIKSTAEAVSNSKEK